MKGSALNNPARGSEDADDMHVAPAARPKGATSDNVLAAQLVDRILRFRAEAKAELANFPATVRERLDKRTTKAMGAASPTVRVAAEALLKTHEEPAK